MAASLQQGLSLFVRLAQDCPVINLMQPNAQNKAFLPMLFLPAQEFLDPDSATALATCRPFDYVVDCIDSVAPKCALLLGAHAAGIPVVSSMGAGGRLDPSRVRVADIAATHRCVWGDGGRFVSKGGIGRRWQGSFQRSAVLGGAVQCSAAGMACSTFSTPTAPATHAPGFTLQANGPSCLWPCAMADPNAPSVCDDGQ